MNKLCCVVFALLPVGALAATYPIEVEKKLNGAEVSASSQAIDVNMAGIELYNYGKAAAECKVVFRNGPESPRTRKAALAPGQSALLTSSFKSQVIKLRIKVTCNPK
ncbi:3-phosphoglycerate kinase [Pseudomonas cavernae]|uniref:3-phosphoglycerate kinase n=1 Tax=Pseudomonas cavernae TaxID=2320867 RepID=A0A385Z706_9PSED|nr:3-phosphoglycerate kinase [Pseudomonas cavernae]AYC33753.1 3-phosphoglycerate kinase [Pseudomonas cavernae]